MGCGSSKERLTDESKFDKVVGDAFERIYAITNYKKGKFINFAPIWVANNTKEGGLGILRFHFSEQDCHLDRDKLIGNTYVNRDDVVEFYHQVAKHKESLAEFDLRGELHNLTQCMEFVVKFYKENQDEIVKRMEQLVKFFNKVDTPANKWIDKNELIAFYEHVVEKDLKMDEDHFLLEHKSEAETSFKWIDRNGDGKITLAELVSFALAPSMLSKKYADWVQQLEVLGIELKYAEDSVPVKAVDPVSAVTDD